MQTWIAVLLICMNMGHGIVLNDSKETNLQNVPEYTSSSTEEDKAFLDSWIGSYRFIENEHTRFGIGYTLKIYKEEDQYYADLHVANRFLLLAAKATVQKGFYDGSIAIVFEDYLPEGEEDGPLEQFANFKKGDTLCVLFWSESDIIYDSYLFTQWVELSPTFHHAFEKIDE